jgi:hypothetical protein
MELNELKFGNPNRRHLMYLNTKNYLDTLLEELSSIPPPPNDGEYVLNELNQLVNLTNELAKENEEVIKKFHLYDYEFEKFIIEKLVENGVDQKEATDSLIELHKDIVPLLVKLKYTYQRVRPYVLADYRQIQLYPFRVMNADSPTYPSGHTYQSLIYAEVLGNKYPKFYKALQKLADDIRISRESLGVHYSSDNEFAMYCASKVLEYPEFRKKYKL